MFSHTVHVRFPSRTHPHNWIIPDIVPPASTIAGQPNPLAGGGSVLLDMERQRGVSDDAKWLSDVVVVERVELEWREVSVLP